MTLIELGDVSAEPEPQPRAPLHPLAWRRWGAAVVAVLCLLVLTASVRPPAPRGLTPLWSMDYQGVGFTVTDRSVYVRSTRHEGMLEAYDLADGRKRWEIAAPQPEDYVIDAESAGAMLLPVGRTSVTVTSSDSEDYSAEVNPNTRAVDVRTGATLWERPGEFTQRAGGLALLVSYRYPEYVPLDLSVVRVADGRTMWSRRAPAGTAFLLTAGPSRDQPEQLVTAARNGSVQVLNFADGTPVGAGRVPWAAAGEDGSENTELVGGRGGSLVVARKSATSSTVTAYDVRSLRQRWERRLPAGDGLADCGQVLCFAGGGDVTAYDWSSGATRWTTPWQYAYPVGGGRLLAVDRDSSNQALLDEATGRQIADVRDGQLYHDERGGAVIRLRGVTTAPYDFSVSRYDERIRRFVPRGTIAASSDGQVQMSGDRLVYTDKQFHLVVTVVG